MAGGWRWLVAILRARPGLSEGRGATRGLTYTLSAQVYLRLGQGADYIRQAGFGPIQQEQMVLQYAHTQGRITRSEAAELCRLSLDQAKRLLLRMVAEGQLAQQGAGKATYYQLTPHMRARPHFLSIADGTRESQMRQYYRTHVLEGRFIEDYHQQRVKCKTAAAPRRFSR